MDKLELQAETPPFMLEDESHTTHMDMIIGDVIANGDYLPKGQERTYGPVEFEVTKKESAVRRSARYVARVLRNTALGVVLLSTGSAVYSGSELYSASDKVDQIIDDSGLPKYDSMLAPENLSQLLSGEVQVDDEGIQASAETLHQGILKLESDVKSDLENFENSLMALGMSSILALASHVSHRLLRNKQQPIDVFKTGAYIPAQLEQATFFKSKAVRRTDSTDDSEILHIQLLKTDREGLPARAGYGFLSMSARLALLVPLLASPAMSGVYENADNAIDALTPDIAKELVHDIGTQAETKFESGFIDNMAETINDRFPNTVKALGIEASELPKLLTQYVETDLHKSAKESGITDQQLQLAQTAQRILRNTFLARVWESEDNETSQSLMFIYTSLTLAGMAAFRLLDPKHLGTVEVEVSRQFYENHRPSKLDENIS